MIKFTLRCDQHHEFESWFASGDAFDRLKELKQIACPTCTSTAIEKAIMAPAVNRTDKERGRRRNQSPKGSESGPHQLPENQGPPNRFALGRPDDRALRLVQLAREIRQHLRQEGEYVGSDFASKARARHEAAQADKAGEQNDHDPASGRPPDASEQSNTAPTPSQRAEEGSSKQTAESGAAPDDERPLWGEATLSEARELIEDGIMVLPLPDVPEDHN